MILELSVSICVLKELFPFCMAGKNGTASMQECRKGQRILV
jgi:hypothetical protein